MAWHTVSFLRRRRGPALLLLLERNKDEWILLQDEMQRCDEGFIAETESRWQKEKLNIFFIRTT